MVESKWGPTGECGHAIGRNVAGPLRLRVWWASGVEPKGSTLPPYKAAVFGYTLKTRFETLPEAEEAAEKVALRWAQAAVVELAEEGEHD